MPPNSEQATEDDLMARFAALGIAAKTHRHALVFTVDEARALRGDLKGGHCKCLFLKDKKSALWLIVVEEDRAVDLKALSIAIGAARFSFGKPELLLETLGVAPGAVTPYAAINDLSGAVQIVLDQSLMDFAVLNFHPLHNAATTAIAPGDLVTFLRDTGHEPIIHTFPN
jgi:Ala-tRNA(Pro) deacylase